MYLTYSLDTVKYCLLLVYIGRPRALLVKNWQSLFTERVHDHCQPADWSRFTHFAMAMGMF